MKRMWLGQHVHKYHAPTPTATSAQLAPLATATVASPSILWKTTIPVDHAVQLYPHANTAILAYLRYTAPLVPVCTTQAPRLAAILALMARQTATIVILGELDLCGVSIVSQPTTLTTMLLEHAPSAMLE